MPNSGQNLKNKPVWMFSNSNTTATWKNSPENMKKLREYFEHYGSEVEFKSMKNDFAFPTDSNLNTEKDCMEREFKIGNCGYDGVGKMLKHLIKDGEIKEPEANWERYGTLQTFNQKDFAIDGATTSALDDVGLVYVPTFCNRRDAGCKLHVAIHGVHQSMSDELNSWAY